MRSGLRETKNKAPLVGYAEPRLRKMVVAWKKPASECPN